MDIITLTDPIAPKGDTIAGYMVRAVHITNTLDAPSDTLPELSVILAPLKDDGTPALTATGSQDTVTVHYVGQEAADVIATLLNASGFDVLVQKIVSDGAVPNSTATTAPAPLPPIQPPVQ